MSITLEKIDMIMQRANVSYKEAKEALERHNGDILEALIELEAEQKTARPKFDQGNREERRYRQNHQDFWTEFSEGAKQLFKKMSATSLTLSSKEKQYFDIPMIVAAILVVITLPVSLFLLILPYCFGMRFDIKDSSGHSVYEKPSTVSQKDNTTEF